MAPSSPTYGATWSASQAAVDSKGQAGTRALLFACLLMAVVVSEGYDFGVLNGAMVLIQEDFGITTLQVSMIAAVTPISIIPGSLLGSHLADWLGRWSALLMNCVVLAIGPIGMATSSTLAALVLFRMVVGFGIGAALVVVNMYLAEITPAAMRGRFMIMEECGVNVGVLMGYTANTFLIGAKGDWRLMLGLGGVLPITVGLLLFLPQIPESPRWLFMAGFDAEAESTMLDFVGEEEARVSLALMREQRRQVLESRSEVSRSPSASTVGSPEGSPQAAWRNPQLQRGLLAGITVAIAQIACGLPVILYFSSTVLKQTMSTQDAFRVTLIMGFVKLGFLVVALLLLERTGRRALLMASAVATMLATFWLSISFLQPDDIFTPATGFLAFAAGHSMGLGPVTYVYLAEVFSTEWRGKGMAIALSCGRVFVFIELIGFPFMLEEVGPAKTFALQGAFNILIVVCVWAFAHETGGHTLESVSADQAMLSTHGA